MLLLAKNTSQHIRMRLATADFAITDLYSGIVTLFEKNFIINAGIIFSIRDAQSDKLTIMNATNDSNDVTVNDDKINKHLWNSKVKEIGEYKHAEGNAELTQRGKEKIASIYCNKYKLVFLGKPSKITNFSCTLRFKPGFYLTVNHIPSLML